MQTRNTKAATRPPKSGKAVTKPDDFVSVARRLGADESKERFEKKLGNIAKAKPAKR